MTLRPARVGRSVFTPLGDRLLRIVVAPGESVPAGMDAAQRERWEALCAENPALFDGPIYSVTHVDAGAGEIRCRRSRYHEVLLRRPGDPVRLLSVTGLLLDGARERVLLGQRGARLRSYPGMWEIGPAGGIEPRDGQRELGLEEIRGALAAEIAEEIGLPVDVGSARAIGICSDDAARSLDIIMRVQLPSGPAPEPRHGEGWEYDDAAWVAIDDLPAFTRAHDVIEPSLAAMTGMGWIDQPPPSGSPPP